MISRLLPISLLTLSPLLATAEQPRIAIGADISTLGAGAQIHAGITKHFNVRLAYHGLSASYDVDAEDGDGIGGNELNYSGDLKLSNGGVVADWYPLAGGNGFWRQFRVSAGWFYNGNKLENTSSCNNALGCEFGNSTFQPLVLGNLSTDVEFNSTAPFVGIGWGNPTAAKGFNFFSELGAYFQGSADVTIRSDGTCNSLQACRDQLAAEEREIEEEADDLSVYPVLTVGLSYRF